MRPYPNSTNYRDQEILENLFFRSFHLHLHLESRTHHIHCVLGARGLTPPRLAKRQIAGLVIPWILSRSTLRAFNAKHAFTKETCETLYARAKSMPMVHNKAWNSQNCSSQVYIGHLIRREHWKHAPAKPRSGGAVMCEVTRLHDGVQNNVNNERLRSVRVWRIDMA